MAKLSTEKLRIMIGGLAEILRDSGSNWPDEDEENYSQVAPTNPANWKRLSKSKISTKMRSGYLCEEESINSETIAHFIENELGLEAETIIDSSEITGECIVRHFCYGDYTCDCAVISDEKDEKVLRLIWHHC